MRKQEIRKLSKRQQEVKKQKKRKKRRIRMAVLIIEVLVLCVLSVAAYGIFKLDKLDKKALDNLIKNNGVEQEGYTNVALFGTDNRKGETAGVRSDCIIVASIDNKTKEVKLLSVYRDTLLQRAGEHYDKANSAYAVGGPEEAVNMLNVNLDLDIKDYVSVNFMSLADIVDLLGGLDMDLTYEEVCHMNNYCVETSEITGKDYTPIDPEEAGTYHLNGVQVVSYSRIRYTEGGDAARTQRQRLVIEKLAEAAKKAKLSTINDIIDAVLPEVSTSFSSTDIIALAADMLKYSVGESQGFPFDYQTPESIPGYEGSYVVAVDLAENARQAHAFLFPDETYEPTETVTAISNELSDETGIYGKSYSGQDEGIGNTEGTEDTESTDGTEDTDYDEGYDESSGEGDGGE